MPRTAFKLYSLSLKKRTEVKVQFEFDKIERAASKLLHRALNSAVLLDCFSAPIKLGSEGEEITGPQLFLKRTSTPLQ